MNYERFSWRPTNTPILMQRRFDDIWFFDEKIGWAVNAEGFVLKTEDGGNNWIPHRMFAGAYLRCIAFANDKLGWIGTTARMSPDDRLFQTEDGGATWNPVRNLPPGSPEQICGIWVVDENTVYACGSNIPEQPTALIKTTDGGGTWTAIDMKPQAASLIDIYFTDAKNGWMTGGQDSVMCGTRPVHKPDLSPIVLRTRDGGQSWVNVVQNITNVFPRGEWGWKIQALPPSTLLIVLQNYRDGAILRSDDDGVTWRRLRVNDRQRNSNLEGIGFLDHQRGWVGGWGDLTYVPGYSSWTVDGGGNWDAANEVLFRVNRFRMIGFPVRVAYAAGASVYKFTDEPIIAALDTVEPEKRLMIVRDAATIPVDVPQGAQELLIDVFEPGAGMRVKTLVHERNPAPGTRRVMWPMTDGQGDAIPEGIYFVRVSVDVQSHIVAVRHEPVAAGPSFAADIKPLFREFDRDTMVNFGLDLYDYESVRTNAEAILRRLEDGSMPCDATWDGSRIALFKSWLDGGFLV